MPPVLDRSTFESLYAGQPRWEIGRPQKAITDVADQITGSILDAGCGSGNNALFFAGRGCIVTGIDFLAEPIKRAKQKAVERGVTATFLVKDVLTLKDWPEQFDNVIDSGLFHVFNDEDRRRYVEGLLAVLKPGGKFFLLCFSDDEPGSHNNSGMAVISFDFSAHATWPSDKPNSLAHTLTECNAPKPALASWLRRAVLPSIA